MISELARKFTEKVFPEIDSEQASLYAYGFFILFSNSFSLVLVFILGIFMDIIWESLLFYLVFTILREYSGGIHARKEITCIFCTTLAFVLSIAEIKLLEITGGCAIQAVLLVAGTSCIFCLSPLDTPQKPLEVDEHILFGRKSKQICVAVDLLAIFACVLDVDGVMNAISMGLALEGILLITGKIQSKLFDAK